MKLRHVPPAVTLALCAVLPLAAQQSSSCDTRPSTLAAMRNCYRPLLVFAPSAASGSFRKQQSLLEQYADDMMDRNILYVPLAADSAHFTAPLDAPYAVLSKSQLASLRHRFQVAPDAFTVILLGEDGGEKFRASTPVSVLKLDGIVDAMPMRKQDMQQ